MVIDLNTVLNDVKPRQQTQALVRAVSMLRKKGLSSDGITDVLFPYVVQMNYGVIRFGELLSSLFRRYK